MKRPHAGIAADDDEEHQEDDDDEEEEDEDDCEPSEKAKAGFFNTIINTIFGRKNGEAEGPQQTAGDSPATSANTARNDLKNTSEHSPESEQKPQAVPAAHVATAAPASKTVPKAHVPEAPAARVASAAHVAPAAASQKEQERRLSSSSHTHHSFTQTQPTALTPDQRLERNKRLKRARQQEVLRRNQVQQAAALVTRALHAGPWPSPVKQAQQQPLQQQHAKHYTHMCRVGASLQRFANDAIVPSMLHAASADASTATARGSGIPSSVVQQRTFLATLVLLREVLQQNAGAIFGMPLLDETDHSGDTKQDEEEDAFSARVLATAVIVTGMGEELAEDVQDDLVKAFLDLTTEYDNATSPELVSCMERLDNAIPCLPTGVAFPQAQATAWRLSYNLARQDHPLVAKKPGLVQVVKPHAAHVTILESQDPSSNKAPI